MKIEEIEKLCKAATPGPWYVDKGRPDGYLAEQDVVRASKPINACTDVIAICNKNAQFIATSRTLVPKLLAITKHIKSMLHYGYANLEDPKLAKLLDDLEKMYDFHK